MTALLLQNATLIDGTGTEPRSGVSVLVQDGTIAQVGTASELGPPAGTDAIDLSGHTLMPGLMDAHVHFGLVGVGGGSHGDDDSLVAYTLGAIENMNIALQEGFTTVRDAGGLDPAFARAVDQGLISGPRILPSGSPLSQTGGHGDHRGRYDTSPQVAIPGLLASTALVDGVDAVRAAARQQLRLGATQIKVMASGGVMSQMDKLDSLGFSVAELSAAVQEARAAGTYVLAHCHTSPSMNNALDAGVRSLEHASILDEPTAARIAELGAFVVPTLLVIERLAESPEAEGVSHYSAMKLEQVRGLMPGSVRAAHEAGVSIGSGSDILGERQTGRGGELAEKAKILGPMAAIVSATSTNARLFNLEDRIGVVREGYEADLIAVSDNPLADIELLADGTNVPLVVKGGEVVKNAL